MAATCVYCHGRKGKRSCPALNGLICSTIQGDRKSTRLNSSHGYISYAVFCLKKKKYKTIVDTMRHSASAILRENEPRHNRSAVYRKSSPGASTITMPLTPKTCGTSTLHAHII